MYVLAMGGYIHMSIFPMDSRRGWLTFKPSGLVVTGNYNLPDVDIEKLNLDPQQDQYMI